MFRFFFFFTFSFILQEEMMQFNAHSHFVFPSCSKLPNSTRVKEKAHVPVGVVIAPLAPVPDGFPEVPTVNFGTAPLVRCKRCHAYINPFVRWEGNGDRWFCNLCGNMNDTPAYYAKPLDEQGKRVDRMERPELSCGSVEIIASADYMARPPQPPAFMFLIEVSADAVYCGLVEAACSAIKRVLSSGELPGGSRTKVGIITFDSAIQFYNISSELSQPQMLVVPENDVFLPLPDEVMVNAQENLEGLLSLLDQLPNMWAKNTTVETCMGSAVDAAFMAMNHVGGKLSIFISTLPTIGKFALSKNSRSSSKQKTAAAELEMQFLRPSDESYKSIGTDLAQYQISVDIFVCSTQSVDLPTLYPISKFTAGEIHYYPKFQIRLHGDRLGEELLQCFKNILAWEAVMRFRVSRGWRISKWFGHFYIRTGEILIVPNCRAEQTFSILLEMDENVAQENVVYIQAALLYSNSAGERRIRIHTYCLPVIHNFADVSASMDTSVAASLLCQQAIEMALKTSLADARNFLQQQCSQIIAAQGPNPSPKTKLLAMYILGLLKSSAFRESKDVSADMRIYHLMRLECSSLNLQVAYFYPRMISLHNLDTRHGTEDEGRNVILPEAMALSSSGMTEEGVYLLEDGETMLMWIGRGVKSSWLEATFGVISLDYLHPEFAEAHIVSLNSTWVFAVQMKVISFCFEGSSGDSLGKRIAIILQELRRLRGASFIKMIVLKQGDPLEYKFFMSLIEDQTECMRISLQEFLSKMCQRGVVASTSYRPR
ncbi:putative transport protein Sec24 [Cardiosporidium cionae]|uniref:Transport protein Sec24 n=1 Tax=Cardiosporidium cionae TaxID=476202 RepID=A0ABQ7J4R6_9APIC|nr:putative transport protein Sec24 [Cardiosporidium cionae]|eukprot:KAF8817997.1 putative transport protein Sec24 [Cardiosporidium cionae]